MRPRVHTQKHIVQSSLFVNTAGTKNERTLIEAVAVADKTGSHEVEQGSTISAIYLEYWCKTNDSSEGTEIAIVEKTSGSDNSVTGTEIANLDSYSNKKNVLHTFMGLTNPATGVSMPIIRQWLKIPKSKQRFGLGDKLIITWFSQTGTLQTCGFALYKEQM